MKLSQLFPIENCIINGYSLIDNVFGPGFVVYDMLGAMHTSARNVKLLGRAQTVIENIHRYDAQALARALEGLRDEADYLRQEDFDSSVWRESRHAMRGDENPALAGALE